MNVNLTPALEKFVHAKVRKGRYNSASEVVREALRLLEERDELRQIQIQELRKKIDQGFNSLRRGKGVDGGEFFKALAREERVRERVSKQG
jgi:antitoxin ParD1/3/4